MNFQNVLVTGANRGIGLEFVKQLLALSPAPKNVIATTRSDSAELTSLKSANSSLHVLIYDATNYDSYPEFVSKVGAIVGSDGLDLLVNNAGIYVGGKLDTVTPADMLKNVEVNVAAPLELSKQFLPLLKTSASNKRKTVIANISSMAGSIGDNTSGSAMISYPYRTSKAALNMVSRCLAVDLKSSGIIVLAIHPGWVQTDMGGNSAPLTPQASVLGMFDVISKSTLETSGGFVNYQGKDLPL